MTNEQESNSGADKEIIELAEILLALQSRLPPPVTTKLAPLDPSTPATSPSVSLAAAAVEKQVIVESPPSSPEGHSKKENHAPVTPVVNNKRPAPETTAATSSKKDLAEQERKKRKRVTEEQLTILETIFATDKMPDQKLRLQLAQRLGMSSRRVQIWFQNKRAKLKKANANSPNSSPTLGHSIGKLGAGSQALYSARFSLPSANSGRTSSSNNNSSSSNNNNNATSSSNHHTTTPAVSSSSGNSINKSANTPTPNLVAPFNFPMPFHPFASHNNFLGAYPNAAMPGGSYSLPISRPVK